jgi:hypothetical protein
MGALFIGGLWGAPAPKVESKRVMMKRVLSLALLPVGVLVSSRAQAQDEYLCCNLAAQDDVGACVAQSASCPEPDLYGVALSDVAGDGGGFPALAGVTDASFPSGTDGHLSWTKTAPWVGFCLDAPSTEDPTHAGPTEPIGCLTVSLGPGIGAQVATAQFPVSSQWDGYQLCYGAPIVNDDFDTTVSPTPVSGSCCSAAQLLTAEDEGTSSSEWSITVAQELPGILPPVVVHGPDGGLVVNYNPDAGDSLGGIGDAGPHSSARVDGGAACVPTTCEAQNVTCAEISDGCGGTLDCASNCSSQAQACSAAGGIWPTNGTSRCTGPLILLGLAGAWRLRRKRGSP